MNTQQEPLTQEAIPDGGSLLYKTILIGLILKNESERIERRRKSTRDSMRRYPERNKKNSAAWYAKNKASVSERDKKRYLENREREIARCIAYQLKNKAKMVAYRRKRYEQNRDTLLAFNRNRKKNLTPDKKAQYNAVGMANRRARLKRDKIFALICAFRSRVSNYIRPEKSRRSGMTKLIGCSKDELRAHLESQFKPGMTWDNYGSGDGKWVVDHIRPIASFELSDPVEFSKCWNHKNFQPLWWMENIIKSDRFSESL